MSVVQDGKVIVIPDAEAKHAVAALEVTLSDDEVTQLEAAYEPHRVVGFV